MRFLSMILLTTGMLLVSAQPQAAIIQACFDSGGSSIAGNTSQAWVSSSKQYSADANSFVNENSSTRYAAGCLGGYDGNDMPLPSLNLGYRGDGLFNGALQSVGNADPTLTSGLNEWWIDGAFKPELQALQDPNAAVDPGWIYLGKFEQDDNSSEWSKNFAKLGGVVDFADLLDFGIRCDTDDTGPITGPSCDGSSGSWYLTPNFEVPELVAPLLGDNFFTQFALVFKAGTDFVTYNFTLDSMDIDPATVGTGLRPYVFEGGFDFADVLLNRGGNSAGLSHFSIYALDPTGSSTSVSEPAAILILGMGLVLLSLRRRIGL